MMANFKKLELASSLLLVVLSLVVLTITGNGPSPMAEALRGVTLRDVCANRMVPVLSEETVRRLIEEFAANPDVCLDNYQRSFGDLERLLAVEPQDDRSVCSESKFARIREFHLRYIRPAPPPPTPVEAFLSPPLVPVALSQFFQAWALQVSGLCKRALVENLDKAVHAMSDEDYALLEGKALVASMSTIQEESESFTVEVSEDAEDAERHDDEAQEHDHQASTHMISNFLAKCGLRRREKSACDTIMEKQRQFKFGLSFQKLVYMPEIEGERELGDLARMREPRQLDLSSRPALNKFMHACERRFRPVYAQLILPIVRLAKLGYDYLGPILKDIQAELWKNPLITQWLLVTMVCESQGPVQLVSLPPGTPELPQLTFSPIYRYKNVEGALWVRRPRDLQRELARVAKLQRSKRGLGRLLFKVKNVSLEVLTRLDPFQLSWYRTNQAMLSSFLASVAVMASIFGKTVSLGYLG